MNDLSASDAVGGSAGGGKQATFSAPVGPHTTGAFVAVLPQDAVDEGAAEVARIAGVDLVSTADAHTGALAADDMRSDGVVFHRLGVAVVRADPDRVRELKAAVADTRKPVLAVDEERIAYAATSLTGLTVPVEYLRGYRDAIVNLVAGLPATADSNMPAPRAAGSPFPLAGVDQSKATWGLQVIQVLSSRYTGRGVRIAVLDTGIDLKHPDFTGRTVTSESFVPGQPVQDVNGHGTHCIGTSCGPREVTGSPAYGVACNAEIYAGKVLSNAGSGPDRQILAGLEWAVTNHCRVASLSLSSPRLPGESYSRAFEQVAARAVGAGTLIVAAAGNDSDRLGGQVKPVGHPADCPTVVAVGAIDVNQKIANFSNSTVNTNAGQVDIVGPGVSVFSSWPTPTRYRTISGTSMACPHVAGIAALFAEAHPELSGTELLGRVVRTARRLPLPSSDVGSGLVQAP